uniref:Fibrinogen C-terminal domain-containing protein n=1 Tax=Magallana gigas TaxID=29159 RepID=A0A8W8NWG5_MAGGI
MSYMFRPLLLNAAITLSLFYPFLQGRTTQELFFFSTRNSRYIPGSEAEDILLDDKKSVTWCAVRCLGSPSCLAIDVCYLHTSTRCRMWSAPPGEDSTNKPNCRRFLTAQTQNPPADQDTTAQETTSAAIECTNGCSCSAITDQFSAGKQLYSVTLNGDSTTYACKQGADGRIWTLGFSDNTVQYAMYSNFTVGGPDSNYRLHIGGYSGDAGDNIILPDPGVNLNGMMFTTVDKDNDLYNADNCAVSIKGAWWFNNCGYSNLNGMYSDSKFAWGFNVLKLTKTLMLIRSP